MVKYSDKILIALFLFAIWLPTVDLVLKLDPNPAPSRKPVPFPSFPDSLRSSLAFPGQVLWYAKNTMGFQGTLIRLNGLFHRDVLKVSPSEAVVLGSDGWLFQGSEGVIDDYRGIASVTEVDLEQWKQSFEQRRDWLSHLGCQYLVVFTPNKEMVYPEYLPPTIKRSGSGHRLDRFMDYMARRSHVPILDLRAPVIEHKSGQRLYHRTDTHWNEVGGYYGYRAIAKTLLLWYPDLRLLDIGQMESTTRQTRGGDLARIMGLKADYVEELLLLENPGRTAHASGRMDLTYEQMDVSGVPLLVTNCPKGEINSAVIVRDSFAEMLIPYLSEHFREAAWVWSYDLPVDLIRERKPNIVIQQCAERKLVAIKLQKLPE